MLRAQPYLPLLSILLASCFVPNFYRVSFPDRGLEAIPRELFADSEMILALPCWHWYEGPGDCFGPPAIISKQDLDNLPEELASWRGFEMIDLLGHEGGKAPFACGIVFFGSSGVAVRLDHSYQSPRGIGQEGRFFWERKFAKIGPRMKVALEEALANEKVGSENLELLFGLTHARILGESDVLANALRFVEQLNDSGDDVWQTVPAQAHEKLD